MLCVSAYVLLYCIIVMKLFLWILMLVYVHTYLMFRYTIIVPIMRSNVRILCCLIATCLGFFIHMPVYVFFKIFRELLLVTS